MNVGTNGGTVSSIPFKRGMMQLSFKDGKIAFRVFDKSRSFWTALTGRYNVPVTLPVSGGSDGSGPGVLGRRGWRQGGRVGQTRTRLEISCGWGCPGAGWAGWTRGLEVGGGPPTPDGNSDYSDLVLHLVHQLRPRLQELAGPADTPILRPGLCVSVRVRVSVRPSASLCSNVT
jgi:hypothetical protein